MVSCIFFSTFFCKPFPVRYLSIYTLFVKCELKKEEKDSFKGGLGGGPPQTDFFFSFLFEPFPYTLPFSMFSFTFPLLMLFV